MQSEAEGQPLKRVVTESSLASIVSMRSETRMKALMRDELLINAQKFASQVQYCVVGIICQAKIFGIFVQ